VCLRKRRALEADPVRNYLPCAPVSASNYSAKRRSHHCERSEPTSVRDTGERRAASEPAEPAQAGAAGALTRAPTARRLGRARRAPDKLNAREACCAKRKIKSVVIVSCERSELDARARLELRSRARSASPL